MHQLGGHPSLRLFPATRRLHKQADKALSTFSCPAYAAAWLGALAHCDFRQNPGRLATSRRQVPAAHTCMATSGEGLQTTVQVLARTHRVVDDAGTRYLLRLRFSHHKIRQLLQRAIAACSAALQSEVTAFCDPVTLREAVLRARAHRCGCMSAGSGAMNVQKRWR